MAIEAGDWSVDRQTGNIRYIGDDHNGTAPSYATVIELHRWVQDLADDASYSGNDELDIIDDTPSDRATDNYITLINGYNIDAAAAEHLYDGSIVQGGGTDIWDGIVNFGNADVMIQVIQNGAVITDDFWNYSVGGTDDTSAGAAFLTDSTASWTTNEWVGYTIKNVTDGSQAIITANTSTTITGVLYGGTADNWTSGDEYLIAKGLNGDATSGISHRFMIKVRDSGADTDARKLIGTCRRYTKTYNEFTINATNRGNNVLALADSNDLNNTTAWATVDGWADITNLTQGYINIDVNNDSTDEYFYSRWDRGSRTINQFYEFMKKLTADGSVDTLYGLNGELFRGITHEITISTGTGTWAGPENLTWTGGSGRLLAVDDTDGTAATALWLQVLTGVAPTNTQVITGGTSSATATASGTATERPISKPFCGVSTGSALIGAYGFALEYADLSNADLLTALDNLTYQPPNNVTFTVFGLVVDEDRLLVGPESGGSLNEGQFTLNGALTGVTTSVIINGAIPADTPASGTIRITRADGLVSLHPYSAWTGSTFTITSHDFTSNNASDSANVFVSYLDKLADSTPLVATALSASVEYVIVSTGTTDFTLIGAANSSPGTIFTATGAGTGTGTAKPRTTIESFTVVYSSPRSLFIRVRDGGTAGDSIGIKTFETTGTLGSGGGSTTAIRTADA